MTWRLPQASTVAGPSDDIFNFILITSLISFAIIIFGTLFFLIRFWRKKRSEHETPYIHGHTATEASVAVLLTVWVMVIFYWGWIEYKKMRTAPADAMEIQIIGQQWMWEMQYADGRKLTNELVVPKGKPVKLVMTSRDVIHSFFIPDFRVKQDVLPNVYTSLWFEAIDVGEHPIYCAEYCGTAHSGMLGTVRVLEPDDFEAWQLALEKPAVATTATSAAPTLAETGKTLFATKGCQTCHSVDGSKGVGPTQKGVFGSEVELADGSKAKADENYIRESMMEPNKKVVQGFPSIMPTFAGQLKEEEINALIAYIKSL